MLRNLFSQSHCPRTLLLSFVRTTVLCIIYTRECLLHKHTSTTSFLLKFELFYVMLWTVYQNCQNLLYNTSSHSFHLNKFFNVQYWPKDGNMCSRHSQFFGLIIPISTRYQKSRKAGMSGWERGLVQFCGAKFKEPTNAEACCKEFYT